LPAGHRFAQVSGERLRDGFFCHDAG
jgi:hypothetical protein